jgi:penicillin-binding protein 2
MKIGYAFSNHIKTEKIKRRHYKEQSFQMRSIALLFLAVFFSVVLLLKLANIQIVNGEYYRSLSDSNRIRTTVIHAPRGIIMDRNGTPLVFNQPGFRKVENKKTTLLSHDEAVARIAKGERGIEIDSLRQYPYKDTISHVIGYVGQISEVQIQQKAFSLYELTDLIGKDGIEQYYEELLRGENGKQLIEVDAMGKPIRTLGQTEPISGKDIRLTLDLPLQEAVYTAMKDVKKGAVVVSTPQGEILSMVSKPAFDPNLFTLDPSYQVASESGYTKTADILLDSENQPLLNRAISGVYPPGSTFKIITAASGLEEKVITGQFTVQDNGIIRIGPYSFSNWYYTQYGRKEGPVNVIKGIARSNDIFFYKLAQMLDVGRLSGTAAEFGVGKKLGIDLSGEVTGILPTKDWKQKNVGEAWYLGDTFIYGIGQGYLLATPLQVNSWTEIIANGGTHYRPHLLADRNAEVLRRNFLRSDTIRLVREGMVKACSTGGTAFPFFNFLVKNSELAIDNKNYFAVEKASVSARLNSEDMRKIQVACKTGTAQHGGEKTLPHAWITVFAPAYKPEIVVTVLAESSGEGSQIAGPIAKKILEAYFSEK